MSQYLLPDLNAASNNGADLVSFLNQWKTAVLTTNSGAARPTYAARSTLWVKETSTQDSIYLFNGISDILLFTIDRASGTIVSGGGGSGNGAINFKGAVDPTVTAPTATNGDYYISNTDGIIHSSFVGIAGEVGSATDVLIYDGAFWSRIANTIDLSAYMPLGGGTMTGPLILSRDPVDPMEAATRQFVLAQAGGASLPLAGGTLTGPLILAGDPTAPLEAAPMQYVDAQDALLLPLAGGTMTGPLVLNGAPTGANNAATKNYVDNWHDPSKLNIAGGVMTGPLAMSGNAVADYEPVTLIQFNAALASVQVSTGSPSANKLVRTNAVGKIDNSLLTISTGFNYGGQIDPTGSAPANINGNYYILNNTGTFDASFGSPLAGTTGNLGDIVISNGTSWELSPVSQAGTNTVDRDASNLVGTNFDLTANYAVPTNMIDGTDPSLALFANVGIPGGTFGMPNNQIGLIYSDSSGGAPSVADLGVSSLGFNRADLKLYGLDSSNAVQSLIAIPTFTATGMYGQGDLVMHNDRFLQARLAISAGAMNAAQWHDITPGISEYSDTAVYMQDELAAFGGGLYRCLADDTGPETFNPANWESIDSSGFSASQIVNGNSKVEIISANGPTIFTTNNQFTTGFYENRIYTEVYWDQSTLSGYDSQKARVGFINPFSAIVPATYYSRTSPVATSTGGFNQEVFSGGSTQAYNLVANMQTPTTDQSLGVFTFNGRKSNGTTGIASLDAADDLFNLLNNGASVFNVKGDGSAYFNNELYVGGTSLTDLIAGGSSDPTLIVNGTSKVEIPVTDGTVYINSNGEGYATFGGGAVGLLKFFSLTSAGNSVGQRVRTGAAHPFTSLATAATYGQSFTSANGGVAESGYSASTTAAFSWLGYMEQPTTAGSSGVFTFTTRKSNGGTGYTALADIDDAFNILNNGVTKFLVKGDGSFQVAGNGAINGLPTSNNKMLINRTDAGASASNAVLSTNLNYNGAATAGQAIYLGGIGAGVTNAANVYFIKMYNGVIPLNVFTVNGLGETVQYGSNRVYQNTTNGSGYYLYSTVATAHTFSGATQYKQEFINNSGFVQTQYFSASYVASLEVLYGTTPGTSGLGAVKQFNINKIVSGASAPLAANEQAFSINTGTTGLLLVRGNGDTSIGGQLTDYTAINAQTGTTYTTVLSDASKMITMSNAAANTVTIPANASVAYPVGTKLHFMQGGAGQTTIAITTDTLNKNSNFTLKLNGQYAVATAFKQTSTTWVLYGNLEPV